MKIHSKFRDYYDTAMAHGVDDHVHWVRKYREVRVGAPPAARQMLGQSSTTNHIQIDMVDRHEFFETDLFEQRPADWQRRYNQRGFSYQEMNAPDLEPVFVGFCGKVYCGIRFKWDTPDPLEDGIVRVAYTTEDIIKVLSDFDAKKKTKLAKNFIKDKNVNTSGWNKKTAFNKSAIQKYFDRFQGSDFVDYFVDVESPVFVIEQFDGWPKILVNATLADYEFHKVMDSYTAYQEIEMFMGSVLAERDEIDVPGIDDDHLAKAKGYDKWSFKTLPTKHKKRGK